MGAKVDRFSLYQEFVRGEASVAVDFVERTVNVALSNIRDIRFNAPVDDISWQNLSLPDSGIFEGDTISGRFFGPMQEEAAGVFDRGDLVGVFGARRD